VSKSLRTKGAIEKLRTILSGIELIVLERRRNPAFHNLATLGNSSERQSSLEFFFYDLLRTDVDNARTDV
jgi:hypothetical protein